MKRLFLILLAIPALAGTPVQHAVLTPDLTAIERWEAIDPDLVAYYRAIPNKAAKVARYRLRVDTTVPATTLQQKVVDGGWSISATTVDRVWTVVALSAQEIADRNASSAEFVAGRLYDLSREGSWELATLRIDVLQVEIIGLMAKAIASVNLQTNLTVSDRNRFLNILQNLAGIKALYDAAKAHRNNVLSSPTVVDAAAMNWPTNRIRE